MTLSGLLGIQLLTCTEGYSSLVLCLSVTALTARVLPSFTNGISTIPIGFWILLKAVCSEDTVSFTSLIDMALYDALSVPCHVTRRCNQTATFAYLSHIELRYGPSLVRECIGLMSHRSSYYTTYHMVRRKIHLNW